MCFITSFEKQIKYVAMYIPMHVQTNSTRLVKNDKKYFVINAPYLN